MKIKLVFFGWRNRRLEKVSGSERMLLETGEFHPGSSFEGTIEVDEGGKEEMVTAWKEGFSQVFILSEGEGEEKW